jgi:hypothetical protein
MSTLVVVTLAAAAAAPVAKPAQRRARASGQVWSRTLGAGQDLHMSERFGLPLEGSGEDYHHSEQIAGARPVRLSGTGM